MVKKLNIYGKLLYAFTAFFPLYVFWSYYFFDKISSWSFDKIFQINYIGFAILLALSIAAFFVFYGYLIRKPKKPDREIAISNTERVSSYLKYVISSLSPFSLFIVNLYNGESSLIVIILGTAIFVIILLILIFKDEKGILYNLFYLPYHILSSTTKEDKQITIISRKPEIDGYTKVHQLDKEVFKEWI